MKYPFASRPPDLALDHPNHRHGGDDSDDDHHDHHRDHYYDYDFDDEEGRSRFDRRA